MRQQGTQNAQMYYRSDDQVKQLWRDRARRIAEQHALEVRKHEQVKKYSLTQSSAYPLDEGNLKLLLHEGRNILRTKVAGNLSRCSIEYKFDLRNHVIEADSSERDGVKYNIRLVGRVLMCG